MFRHVVVFLWCNTHEEKKKQEVAILLGLLI